MIHSILLVFAFVLLVLATFSVPSGRVNLLAAGLSFWMLDLLLHVG